MQTLSDHFETEWPKEKETIRAFISIQSVYPRFLDDYSFCVGYRSVEMAREITAHEILHFLWFKKWKEVFPESKRQEFESPNLVWRLSEVMDPIILQCHPKIKELIKPTKWGYSEFEKIKIGEIGMTEYFKNLYLKLVKEGAGFDTILKKLWQEAQLHKDALQKF